MLFMDDPCRSLSMPKFTMSAVVMAGTRKGSFKNYILHVSHKQRQVQLFVAANIGGMLGLCMGFSLLSVAELIYFFTVRWAVLAWRKHTEPNAVQDEKLHEITIDVRKRQDAMFDELFDPTAKAKD